MSERVKRLRRSPLGGRVSSLVSERADSNWCLTDL
jgi:hypothetical protein